MAEPTPRWTAQEIQRLLDLSNGYAGADVLTAIIAQQARDIEVLRAGLAKVCDDMASIQQFLGNKQITARTALDWTTEALIAAREALEATRPEGSPLGQP